MRMTPGRKATGHGGGAPAAAAVVITVAMAVLGPANTFAEEPSAAWDKIAAHFKVPPEYAGQLGAYRSPLLFDDGTPVKTPQDWEKRRQQILDHWHGVMGKWPPVIERPKIEYLETKQRDGFTQHKVRVEIAPEQTTDGYLLVPPGDGPFPAVFVPFLRAGDQHRAKR